MSSGDERSDLVQDGKCPCSVALPCVFGSPSKCLACRRAAGEEEAVESPLVKLDHGSGSDGRPDEYRNGDLGDGEHFLH